MKRLRVRAPAKINLFLRVLARRGDGYHEIETLFQAIDVEDELIIQLAPSQTSIEVPGFPDLETETNLAVKAVRRLEADSGRKLPVRMTLRKRIPVAAGLGGGSADAAAALKGVSELFSLGFTDSDLRRAALDLGADVPFFLTGGTAVGEGVGERLTPVTLPFDYDVILVNPGFPVSTAAVFREFSKTLTGKAREGRLWTSLDEAGALEDVLLNDLQAIAESLHPEISRIRLLMEQSGIRKPMMSGSGPTVFGLVEPHGGETVRSTIRVPGLVMSGRPVGHGVVVD